MGLFRRGRKDDELYWGDPQQVPHATTPGHPVDPSGWPASGQGQPADLSGWPASAPGQQPLAGPPGPVPAAGWSRQPIQPRRRAGMAWLGVVVVMLMAVGLVVGLRGGWSGIFGPGQGEASNGPSVTSRPRFTEDQSPATTRSTRTTAGTTPIGSTPQAVTGKQGAAVSVRLGSNSYRITVGEASWQATARWGSASRPKQGYLLIPVTVARTDRAENVEQISWDDWKFAVGAAKPVGSELIGGGYVTNSFTTLQLEPGQTARGVVVFDVPAKPGTLTLGEGARWRLAAPSIHKVAAPARIGQTVKGTIGEVPFDVRLTKIEWIPRSQLSPDSDLRNDYALAITFTLTAHAVLGSDRGRDQLWNYHWALTSGDQTVSGAQGNYGPHSVTVVEFGKGETVTGYAAFDATGEPAVVSVVGYDKQPVMSWRIPGV